MNNQKMYGRSKQIIVEPSKPKKETKRLPFNKELLLENYFYNSSTSILLKRIPKNKERDCYYI
tara:strand:+ start:1313 stop:1501 length:189 start_codon:yes stop_codon:yes gene_type:complete